MFAGAGRSGGLAGTGSLRSRGDLLEGDDLVGEGLLVGFGLLLGGGEGSRALKPKVDVRKRPDPWAREVRRGGSAMGA